MYDISLCGFTFRVKQNKGILNFPYNLFVTKTGKPDLLLEFRYFQRELCFSGKLLFDAQGYWQVYKLKNGKILMVDGFNGYKGYLSRCCVIEEGRIIFYYRKNLPQKYQSPFIYPLGPLILSYLLSQDRTGFILHTSCALLNGKTYLFIGPSGSGKTTIASLLSSKLQIINDDRVGVRLNKNGFECYGLPWYYSRRKYFAPLSGNLRKVFILGDKGKEYIKRIPPTQAFQKIYPSIFLPFWQRRAVGNTLELVKILLDNVACYELGFRKNSNIYNLVRFIIK